MRKQPSDVAAMFDEVSYHYDRTNTVLSVGNATLWRIATTRAVVESCVSVLVTNYILTQVLLEGV